MKRNLLITVFLLGFVLHAIGQDCLGNIELYYSSIDTSERPVYKIAEEMPEIMAPQVFAKILEDQYEKFDHPKCCPIRVWIGFVVESDSSLTNIQVCTKMVFCNTEIVNSESEKFNENVKQRLSKMRSVPGRQNGVNVAVVCIMPIHYECFDWE